MINYLQKLQSDKEHTTSMVILFSILFAVFYFLFIRPQNKKYARQLRRKANKSAKKYYSRGRSYFKRRR